ncbi:MAG: ECF transporter S component [Eubacteriales bacterium]
MNSDMKFNAIDEKNDINKKVEPQSRSALKIILRITFAGVFSALILIATQLFKIPTGIGYANLGDGFILVCAYLLGPAAFFPAAIGSALADLLAGYPVYIPATFVIKGLMGLVAGFLLKNDKVTVSRKILAFTLAELIMVAGYFGYESLPFMYGPAAAAGSVIPNLGQAAVGILMGMILTAILEKQRRSIREKLQ